MSDPPSPLQRSRIDAPLGTGVRAIDGFLTCGLGQRLGIFAGSGVGKSTLMGQMARSSTADVNVVVLVGERGREVREFHGTRSGNRKGSHAASSIVATNDEPSLDPAAGGVSRDGDRRILPRRRQNTSC
jgi:flagellum-specific ATP synthase